jgi:hypothetical protein
MIPNFAGSESLSSRRAKKYSALAGSDALVGALVSRSRFRRAAEPLGDAP